MSAADTLRKHLDTLEASLDAQPNKSGLAIMMIHAPDGPHQVLIDPGRVDPQRVEIG